MKYKKKFGLNDKLFWAGLGVLAIVGVVGFASDIKGVISTSHEFNNEYTYKGYNVDIKSMVNEDEAANVEIGKETGADLIIRNTADTPMLVRIAYVNSDQVIHDVWYRLSIEKNSEGKIIDQSGKVLKGVKFLSTGGVWKKEDEKEIVSFKNWYMRTNNDDKFVYCEDDGFYYYTGVLTSSNSIQHLAGVTLKESTSQSSSDSSSKESTSQSSSDSSSGSWEQNIYSKTTTNSDWTSTSSPGEDFETSIKKETKLLDVPAGKDKLTLSSIIETVQAIDPTTGEVLTDDTLPTDLSSLWSTLLTPHPQTEESTAN